MFDVRSDKEERHDVAKQHPDLVAQLAAKLATFKAYIGAPMNASQYAPYDCAKDLRPCECAVCWITVRDR